MLLDDPETVMKAEQDKNNKIMENVLHELNNGFPKNVPYIQEWVLKIGLVILKRGPPIKPEYCRITRVVRISVVILSIVYILNGYPPTDMKAIWVSDIRVPRPFQYLFT